MKRIVFAALLTLAGLSAYAGETGCVYELEGTALVQKAGETAWLPARKGLPLAEGDRLKTGAKSWCEIVFKDGSFIKLDADSETAAETLRSSAEERTFSFAFLKGKALWMAAKLKGKARTRFAVRTPSAVCAVRGTDFSIALSTAGETSLGLFEGEVEVSNEAGGAKTLAAGEEASAGAGGLTVAGRLSKLMTAEKKRYQKVKKRAEAVRKRLAEREDFIDDYVSKQAEKLADFERRRQEKLKRR